MNIVTKIKQVKSEFDDIYRITTENGLILDIFESNAPKIDSEIEYCITNCTTNDKDFTIMNGIIYGTNDTGIYVSFGGLLANIPLDEKNKKSLSNAITIIYRLKN
jgi:hypothetical protein